MNHAVSPVIALMGPTASGKSALAIHLAQHYGGVILNADAMQCYRGLPRLTAQPSAADMQAAPHALYAIWEPLSHGHAALWQQQAADAIAEAQTHDRLPILVGGTGMYIKLLTEGMAHVPPIDPAIRAAVRQMRVEDAYAQLQTLDPLMAARLKPGDTQRVARALEVMRSTGRSLADWQQHNAPPLLTPDRVMYCHIDIPREEVYVRINRRFEQMIEQGALEEVTQLMAMVNEQPTQAYPLLKSLGFEELAAYVRGEAKYEDAISKAQQLTRNYAKRQMTWIRNQLPPSALAISYQWQQSNEIISHLREIIDQRR